jgi:hypothetical protein
MNTGREHLVRQPLLVASGSIGAVCPDLGTGIVRADDLNCPGFYGDRTTREVRV